jgi:hypothetical protein
MLAVSTSHALRVYQRDGTLRWKRTLTGHDVLAGPAAWREDGRLAVLRRGAVSSWYDPSDWTLGLVDGTTGAPLPDPGLPTVRSAVSLRVTAWRGDTAYAVSRSAAGDRPDDLRASLVRLAPGASAPDTVLAPAGVEDLNVATDYVGAVRAAWSPSYGLSLTGLLSVPLRYAGPVTIAAIIVVLVWWRRRRRRRLPPLVRA